MLRPFALFLVGVAICLTGCTTQDLARSDVEFRNYDLELVHPSPNATYIQVMPGRVGADLPRFRQLDNRAFNEYLRSKIGCVHDAERSIHPIGSRRLPAGYMVPVRCTGSGLAS